MHNGFILFCALNAVKGMVINMKKISKGKDPRSIKLPDYNDKYYEKEKPIQSRQVFLDSFWDGESIDEEKK